MDLNAFHKNFASDGSDSYNFCIKYKYLCITCKSPCSNCTSQKSETSTDTYDFEKYLESPIKKSKHQLKVRSVATDTYDLDSHFDCYKTEKSTLIQKSVATDCADLILRKLSSRKKIKKQSNESLENEFERKYSMEKDREFVWNPRRDPKSYSQCEIPGLTSVVKEENLTTDEVILKSEENKENYDAPKNGEVEIGFENSSSDESDIDLVTSSRVSKYRKIIRSYKMTLTQVEADKEKFFKCGICGKTFQRKHLGVLHLGNHVENGNFKCLCCEKEFSSLELLISHAKVHRGLGTNNNDNILIDEEEGIGKENVDEASTKSEKGFAPKSMDKFFQCVLCLNLNDSPIRYPSYKALYLHKRLKHGAGENKNRTKVERKPRLKREFICLFCGKEFKSNKALNDHLPVHTGEKNYLCEICNKSYTTSANLQIHKRTHMGLKNFKCTLCDKAFHKKDSLKVHFRKHSGERPFQCDICPMKFDRNFILKNHRLRHFSEKTYICPVCGKAFTTHGGLNNHEKSHKRDPGSKKPRKPAVKPTLEAENAVICDVCGKVYSTKSNLRIHKFIHLGVKPFQCPVCQQSYAKKDSMLTHMRKHTDERPFSCETCGMAFYRNHTLKTHRLRHTGERPHKCHMCGKSFTQSSSLTYHIKHHNRKEGNAKIQLHDDQTRLQRKRKFGGGTRSLPVKGNSSPRCEDPAKTSDIGEDPVVVNEESGLNYSKSGPLMVPIIKKEVLVIDESTGVSTSKKECRQSEGFEEQKECIQVGVNKVNYYIAKNGGVSLPKENPKQKAPYRKGEEAAKGDDLHPSKGGCAGKGGHLLMPSREHWPKDVKPFDEMEEHRPEEKPENVLPIAGEILNATFISDQSGEVIPFGSMTLQGVNAENIVISPLIKVEGASDGDKRKGLPRGQRPGTIDTKMKYLGGTAQGKNLPKQNCQILNLKDARTQQRIQLINSEPLSFQIQVPVACTAVGEGEDSGQLLSGLPPHGAYYPSV